MGDGPPLTRSRLLERDLRLMKTPGERAGETISFWERTAEKFYTSPLSANLAADVCVVGAGIGGVTTAYLLARERKNVVLIDDGPVGGGMTGRTTAQFVTLVDDGYDEIEKILGEEFSRLCAESQAAAIDRVESIVNAEKIDCDFERVEGYLFLPPGGSVTNLKCELEAAQRAYDQSGWGPKDADFAEVYDSYAAVTTIACEGLGLCPPGEGARWFASGAK